MLQGKASASKSQVAESAKSENGTRKDLGYLLILAALPRPCIRAKFFRRG